MKGAVLSLEAFIPHQVPWLIDEGLPVIWHLASLRVWELRQRGQWDMESCSWLLCTQKLPLDLPAALRGLHAGEHWRIWEGSDLETL